MHRTYASAFSLVTSGGTLSTFNLAVDLLCKEPVSSALVQIAFFGRLALWVIP